MPHFTHRVHEGDAHGGLSAELLHGDEGVAEIVERVAMRHLEKVPDEGPLAARVGRQTHGLRRFG